MGRVLVCKTNFGRNLASVQVVSVVYCIVLLKGAELVGPKYRKWVGLSNNFFYAFGQMILAGIAFGIREWRLIEITISVIPIIYFSYYWYVLQF